MLFPFKMGLLKSFKTFINTHFVFLFFRTLPLLHLQMLQSFFLDCIFVNFILCLQHFLTFWHNKIRQAHLLNILLLAQNWPFLQGALFLLFERELESWVSVADTLAAAETCFQALSADKARKSVCMLTRVYTDICKYFYV